MHLFKEKKDIFKGVDINREDLKLHFTRIFNEEKKYQYLTKDNDITNSNNHHKEHFNFKNINQKKENVDVLEEDFFSTLFTKFNYIKKHAVFKHTQNIPHIKSDSHLSTIQTLSSQRKKKIKLINFGKRKLSPIPSIYNNINQYNTISMNNIIITSTQKEKKPLMVNNYSEGNINKITKKSLYTFPIINRIIYKKDYTNYVNNLRERSKQRKVITNRKET